MEPGIRRAAASVQLFVQIGAEHGLSAAQCLEGTQLDAAQLFDAGSEVSAAQELQVMRNLQQRLPQVPGLGLQAGLRLRLSTHGTLGYAMLSSATLRDALSLMLRYLDLAYAYCDVRLESDSRELRILIDDSGVPADLRGFLLERIAGGAYALAHEMLGRAPEVRRLCFRMARPAHAAHYAQLVGVEPEFNAGYNLIAVDIRLIDLPLPQANALTQRLCEEQCRMLLNRRRTRSGVAGQVRDRLLQTYDRMPDIEQLAAALHITGRTLRRRLEAESTSYRDLADEVRCTLAEGWLAAGLTVEEVALRLGFSESSSFIRAFKRWTGSTPGAQRGAAAQ
ncbi:AraC family transcriptional regulator [Solimonas sp. K1W22B-7]|uniref:AraC family transcriptional regulator n=1 Tax=Solimonas sp. K1W22B-7 TaxID=2303331 RepID=UPI000E334458|nr:AraC family transcriptional regulator [Solimonas sp. K1W22B-7]AXQ29411.1 AraC family transcriptional regulator [Solimonas sp. K1W22B-7]